MSLVSTDVKHPRDSFLSDLPQSRVVCMVDASLSVNTPVNNSTNRMVKLIPEVHLLKMLDKFESKRCENLVITRVWFASHLSQFHCCLVTVCWQVFRQQMGSAQPPTNRQLNSDTHFFPICRRPVSKPVCDWSLPCCKKRRKGNLTKNVKMFLYLFHTSNVWIIKSVLPADWKPSWKAYNTVTKATTAQILSNLTYKASAEMTLCIMPDKLFLTWFLF